MIYPITANSQDNAMTIAVRAETIGKILKSLRKYSGFTQRELANNIGIAQQTYQGYESGKHEPSIELMIRIANIYDVTLDFITGRNIQTEQSEHDLVLYDWIQEAAPYIRNQLEQERQFTKMIIEQERLKKQSHPA